MIGEYSFIYGCELRINEFELLSNTLDELVVESKNKSDALQCASLSCQLNMPLERLKMLATVYQPKRVTARF